MRTTTGFSAEVLDDITKAQVIGLRAGDEHKFIAIWAVVVDGRVFVRSWRVGERSWRHAFADDPRGAIQVGEAVLPVRASLVGDEQVLEAVDEAYRAKYNTPGSATYVRDLNGPVSRATTTELVPVADAD
jgi:hypothetical protein